MSDVLSCYWDVFINGQKIDMARRNCIEKIEIDELCNGSDSCTLTLNDPDFLFIEDNIFVEESTILIAMGWHSDTYRVTFAGYIAAIDIKFPDNGFPQLSIFCIDNSHLLGREEKSRSWDNVTSADVIQKIAQEHGLGCTIQPGYTFKVQDTITQSNATDIAFCENLASQERDPFMCKLVGMNLFYIKKDMIADPAATLYYKRFPYDVISFSPQITRESNQTSVEEGDINTDNKSIDFATASAFSTARALQGDPVVTSDSPIPKTTFNAQTGQWEVS